MIIIPLFPWETQTPRTFDDLIMLVKVTGRLFGFLIKKEESTELKDIMTSPEKIPKALLSWRFPHTRHEVGSVHDITSIVKKKAQEQFDILKIENVYASDFAIEIISSSIDVFSRWQEDFQYDQLAMKLSDFLYEDKPFVIANSIVACRVILCDDLSELESIAKEFKLEKIKERLYVGGENTPTTVKYNMFNFISGPWREIFISNPIVTLKPETLRSQGYHTTVDELNFLISMIHSLGKFYVISESLRAVRANLEWLS